MNATNFTSPLEIAQLIPIYTYVNVLSSFLFVENQLAEDDQYKYIPIVNSLYKYFALHENNLGKKLQLVQKILSGTDFYGSNSYETLDETFINTMLEYVVKSLVFQKYVNLYGFLSNVTLSLTKVTYVSVIEESRSKLQGMTFENEYGPHSKLSSLAVRKIVTEIILPLFPIHEEDLDIFSVDYIYAQAGLTFFRSTATSVVFFSRNNHTEMHLWRHEMYERILFEECVEMGHVIEQMTLAKDVDQSAITVFAVPALLYYIHEQRDNLTDSIGGIMNNKTHWSRAFQFLFVYLEKKLNEAKVLMKPTAESEFYSAVSSFRNRSTLARELIQKYCTNFSPSSIEEKVQNYMNDNDEYHCYNFTHQVAMPDLREIFMQQIENIKKKCFAFEMYKLKQAIGENLIRRMNQLEVEVYNGFYFIIPEESVPIPPRQILVYPNIAFKCYFPNNDTSEYYGIYKVNSTLQLIKESDDPVMFRKKLQLVRFPVFRRSNFFYKYKGTDEKFERFLAIVASEQTTKLGNYLEQMGYEETRMEWWTNFGLSLIPYYSCIHSIFDKYEKVSYGSCIIDTFMLIPLMSLYVSTSSIVTKAIMISLQATVHSLIIRVSLQAVLRTIGSFATQGLEQFMAIFNRNFFKHLGIAVLRFLDPGFELSFRIGTLGFRSIKAVVTFLKRESIFTTNSIDIIMIKILRVLAHSVWNVGRKYERDVYVQSLDEVSGYGFRYVRINDNQIAELRSFSGKKKSPYIFERLSKNNERVYKKFDIVEWKPKHEEVIFRDEQTVSDVRMFEMRVVNNDNLVLCEGGNFLCVGKTKDRTKEAEIARLTEVGMDEPELFFDLQNKENFQSSKFTNRMKVKSKFAKLYPYVTLELRDMSIYAHDLFDTYLNSKAFLNLQFEDFVAIRYYGADGYVHIRGESDIAKRMKNALYRLAIRQSNNPISEFATELFRGEYREVEEMEKFFSPGRKDMVFNRFTSTTSEHSVAQMFTMSPSTSTALRVTYQMRFNRPYLRAKVDDYMILMEKETILLPGTKFKIDNTEWVFEGEKKVGLKVLLTFDHDSIDLLDWQKNVMHEIKTIKDSGTALYVKDLKKLKN